MESVGGKVKTFRDLLVWQKAIRLVTEIYGASHCMNWGENWNA